MSESDNVNRLEKRNITLLQPIGTKPSDKPKTQNTKQERKKAMSYDEIIKLFQEIEADEEGYGPPIGYHLHDCIKKAVGQRWYTNQNYPPTFSGFLTALKEGGEA